MSKYSLEFKLEVVQYYLSNLYGQQSTANRFKIARANVRTWVSQFSKLGAIGLESHKHSGTYKCQVVEFKLTHQLSLSETGAHFGISFSSVAAWCKIYLAQGKQALIHSKKGRPTMSQSTNKPTSKPNSEKTHAELIAELEYLQMENEYLKKFDALIQKQHKMQKNKH